jgi:hypothetical protein
MRLDVHLVAGVADRAARADVDAGVATLFSRSAVRADLFAVVEKARLFELTDQADELLRGERLLERVGARREIALRQLVRAQERLSRKVEHQVEGVAAQDFAA